MAEETAGILMAALARAIEARGHGSLVATGGRSPGRVYDRLAEAEFAWEKVTVTLSDERCVAACDPNSNEGLLRARLLRGTAVRADFIPLYGADDPEPRLRALLPFDAVMLGMGEDGHVASLIPGMPGLAAALAPDGADLTQNVAEGWGAPPLARITLTMSAILKSRLVLILTAGEAKRRVVEAAYGGADLPVRALLAQTRVPVRVHWSPNHDD